GKGKAKLDNVGAGGRQGAENLQRRLRIRVAGHDIGDEGGAALGLQGGEARLQATGSGHQARRARCSATAARSLSPRPERLTTTMPPLPTSRVTSASRARAWADSSAGMMPSSRASSWKASLASSSAALR